MTLPPRTEEDVRLLIENMESYYAPMFTSFEEDDAYYEGDTDAMDLTAIDGYELVIATTGRAVVDEAVDNVDPYDIIVSYAPRGFGEKPQQDAESVQRFLKHVWRYWRRKNSDVDVVRDFLKNMFKNGKAVWKLAPDWTLWPSLEADVEAELRATGGSDLVKERVKMIKKIRDNNFPILLRSLSPMHIMEDPSLNSRKLWCIERYDMPIDEVKTRYSEWVDELGDVEDHTYEIHEFWSASYIDWDGRFLEGQHRVFISGVEVESEPNPYHDLPFVIKYSGLGRETYEGRPELKAMGFFTTQVRSMLKSEIRRLSHFDAIMSTLAFPIVFLPEEAQDFDIEISPGAVNYVPTRVWEQISNVITQTQIPAPEYQQSLNMIQNQIERGTTQRAIRGAGVPGTDSAAQLQMITSQAKLRLEPMKRATEEACDMVNSIVLNWIENIFEDTVSIFGAEPTGPDKYSLKPNQIKGKYTTKTDFMPSDEQIKERKLMLATEAMTKAGLNQYDALVYAGWDNAMEVIGRNLAYGIMDEPAIKRAMAKRALDEWGYDAVELETEELLEQADVQDLLAKYAQMLQAGSVAGSGEPENVATEGGAPGAGIPEIAPQEAGAPLGGAGFGGGRPDEQLAPPQEMPTPSNQNVSPFGG